MMESDTLARARAATGIDLVNDPRRKTHGVYALRRVVAMEYAIFLLKRAGMRTVDAQDFMQCMTEIIDR